MRELRRRTWRWFVVRVSGLGPDTAWSHALWPADPKTGERSRRVPVVVIDDEAEVDAFFARQAG